MCFLNLAKALFMSPTWATWAILVAPLVVIAVWIVVKRHNGVGQLDEGEARVYGASGASWRALGWAVVLTALGFYVVDVGLFYGGKTRTIDRAFEKRFVGQSAKSQDQAALVDGFSQVLESVGDEAEFAQLLAEQGAERKTGAERHAFLQEGDAVSEPLLRTSLARQAGMAGGKRQEWLDMRKYPQLLGDLSQNEWSTLLGTLGKGEGVVGTLLTSLFADSDTDGRQGLWAAVAALSPLPPWAKVAYAAGCVGQRALVKFFLAALGWLRGLIQLLIWLNVGLGMVLAGGGIVGESKEPLYPDLDELTAKNT